MQRTTGATASPSFLRHRLGDHRPGHGHEGGWVAFGMREHRLERSAATCERVQIAKRPSVLRSRADEEACDLRGRDRDCPSPEHHGEAQLSRSEDGRRPQGLAPRARRP